MDLKSLLDELQTLQNEIVDLISNISEKDIKKQFHPDLSPLGWHLGHCVFIELYWIREQCLQNTIEDALKSLYFPELSHKPSRGTVLPEKKELLDWARHIQAENRELIKTLSASKKQYDLLKNNFLIHFLIQHYSQHIETMYMVLTERQQTQTSLIAKVYNVQHNIVDSEFKSIKTGLYKVGSNDSERTYDNERSLHSVVLDQFSISSLPVNNKEYKQFINEDGYSNKDFWSNQGWSWINKTQYKYPHHWHKPDGGTNYFGVNHDGPYSLENNQPVLGLSYYEAEAYANWKGARLPHEYEWEVAALNNQLQQVGLVWEWCSNTFFPYKDFKSYPYDGYSVPYFDNKHYVLRGGSRYTKIRVKRFTFRNYYTADKRHIFAGVRLVQD